MFNVFMETSLPIKHRLGKLLVGTIAGFAATTLAEKGYDVGLKAWQNRKTVKK